ncbi:MAG TPA: polysaccharide biosynthesis tyrosine autokinase [Armatimonadota bacterium]
MDVQELITLQQAEDFATQPPDSIFTIITRRWQLMVSIILVFLVAGVGEIYLRPPIYRAVSSIQVVTESSPAADADALDSDFPPLADLRALSRGRSVDTQVEILNNLDLLTTAFGQLTETDRQAGFTAKQKPSDPVAISAKPNTNIINITVRARDPEAAAAFANSIADTYFASDQITKQQLMRQAREFIAQRLAETRAESERAKAALADYQAQTGLVSPDEQFTKSVDALLVLQNEVPHLEAQVDADTQAVASLRASLSGLEDSVIADTVSGSNPQYAHALQTLQDLHTERARLQQEYTPASREMQAIQAQIADQEGQLRQISTTVVTSVRRGRNPVRDDLYRQYAGTLATKAADTVRLRALSTVANRQLALLRHYPGQQQQWSELLVNARLLQEKVQKLKGQYQSLVASENSSIPSGRFVARAHPLNTPILPNPGMDVLLALALGVMAAVIGALISEAVDDRITDRTMIERVAGSPCLGIIPRFTRLDEAVVHGQTTRHRLLEPFFVLCNRLSCFDGDPMRLLAVTSSAPGEGKTLCSRQLARAIAAYGKRVLLVDGNLRHPSLHVSPERATHGGLVQVVIGGASLESAITSSDDTGVDILPTGLFTVEPSLIYAAMKQQDLLRKLAVSYDAIIVDGPSCQTLSDVQVLATLVDSVLLIVAEHQTSRRALREAGVALRQTGIRFTGIMLNKSTSRERL